MMTQIRTMGPTEARLLNRLAANGHVVFTTDQARAVLNIDDRDINKILYQLTRKRWLLRLEKGKYLILPLEAGMEGLYSIHEFVIAAHLVHPSAIAYASALSFHELSDLVPQAVLVATTRRKADVIIEELGVRFRFITIRAHKFFGLQTVMIEDQPIQITGPAKTLVDGLDHPELGANNLYRARVTAFADGVATDEQSHVFGIKEVRLSETGPEGATTSAPTKSHR